MENKSNERAATSGPRDSSLEAFKAWIRELINRFTSNKAEIAMTEQEWIRYWKEYWGENNHKA
jgi:hypothetical protein